jgi:hypothetical protein
VSRTRRELILVTVDDLVIDFLDYGRDEDEDLEKGEIEDAVTAGELTVEDIIERFAAAIRERL